MTGVAGGVDDEVLEDARRFGFSEDVIEALEQASAAPPAFNIWRVNIDAVAAFAVASTQWRTAGTSAGIVFIGLDYAGAIAGIEAAGMKLDANIWSDVQVMETEALSVLNHG